MSHVAVIRFKLVYGVTLAAVTQSKLDILDAFQVMGTRTSPVCRPQEHEPGGLLGRQLRKGQQGRGTALHILEVLRSTKTQTLRPSPPSAYGGSAAAGYVLWRQRRTEDRPPESYEAPACAVDAWVLHVRSYVGQTLIEAEVEDVFMEAAININLAF